VGQLENQIYPLGKPPKNTIFRNAKIEKINW